MIFPEVIALWYIRKNYSYYILAAGKICFEQRIGALDASDDSHQQRLINANFDVFKYSVQMKFALSTDNLEEIKRKQYAAEDFFYGSVILIRTRLPN